MQWTFHQLFIFFGGGGVITENQEQLQILLTIYDLKKNYIIMKKITSQKCKVIALESYFKVGKCNIAALSNTIQLHLLHR